MQYLKLIIFVPFIIFTGCGAVDNKAIMEESNAHQQASERSQKSKENDFQPTKMDDNENLSKENNQLEIVGADADFSKDDYYRTVKSVKSGDLTNKRNQEVSFGNVQGSVLMSDQGAVLKFKLDDE